MKRVVRICIISAVLLSCVTHGSAQKIEHFVGPWVNGGYYSILPFPGGVSEGASPSEQNPFDLGMSNGGGGVLGVTYELRVKKHFLLDAGVGYNSGWTLFSIPTDNNVRPNFSDITNAYWTNSIQFPILVGGQWKNFYFLAGLKNNIVFSTTCKLNGKYQTPGTSNPEKLTEVTVTSDNVHYKKYDLAFSMELGFRIGDVYEVTGFDVPKQNVQYRLAFFADFGLLDFCDHNPQKNDLVGAAQLKSDVMSSNSYSKGADGYRDPQYHSLLVGLKFTVLFRMPDKRGGRVYRDDPFRSNYGIIE